MTKTQIDDDYRKILTEIVKLMDKDPHPQSKDGVKLERLVKLAQIYERQYGI